MKIACNGATGRVGKILVERYGFLPLSADITNEKAVQDELDRVQPDTIIHLAGISNVDYCEEPSHWHDVVNVNFRGALNVIRAANYRGIGLGYVSSEHVFTGRRTLLHHAGPYRETDIPDKHVVNNYGLVRVAVEGLRHSFQTMKVIRTSYLFDYLRLMNEEFPKPGTYDFPTFIVRSYMYLPHFANAVDYYARFFNIMPPILHIAGNRTVSQYRFMSDFAAQFHPNLKIVKRTKEKTGLAPRPHYAGLDVSLSKRYNIPQFSYQEGFQQMWKDIQ